MPLRTCNILKCNQVILFEMLANSEFCKEDEIIGRQSSWGNDLTVHTSELQAKSELHVSWEMAVYEVTKN